MDPASKTYRKAFNVLTCAGLLLVSMPAHSQVTNPVIKANFGIDGDLTSNVFLGALIPGSDDWFGNGSPGSGAFMIDTSGAAAWISLYNTNPESRRRSFTRKMNYPFFSHVNGRMVYDAIMVRDHHQNDSTSFVVSNKNGEPPRLWAGGVQPLPMKNDLKDVFMHIRRDGTSFTDSLWMIGGLSLEGNTGNRYFDVELYQTDMYYDGASGTFKDYGLDSGHTAWRFDAAGNVTQVGDIIFTGEFSSSSLSFIEARLWVHSSALSITPSNFNWGGSYDSSGMGSRFGYASIVPKTAGDFYTGFQSAPGTWAGPFGNVSITTGVANNYDARQFMEVSVNLTKIGLDPYSMLGFSDGCTLPFKRIFVKTRSATAFTAELKDFIGPFKLARPDTTIAAADLSLFCDANYYTSTLSVLNPIPFTYYTWSTIGGNILSVPAAGPSIMVDAAGTYIVTHTLAAGCLPFSADTIVITRQPCYVLGRGEASVTAKWIKNGSDLLATVARPGDYESIQIERNTGAGFQTIKTLSSPDFTAGQYRFRDDLVIPVPKVDYRLRLTKVNRKTNLSEVATVYPFTRPAGLVLYPNPSSSEINLVLPRTMKKAQVGIYSLNGTRVWSSYTDKPSLRISLEDFVKGIYILRIEGESEVLFERIVRY